MRDGTPPDKKRKKNTSRQEKKTPPNKENLPKQGKTNLPKQGKTPINNSSKKNTFQNKGDTFRARKTPFKQGYLPIKCSLQVVGVFRQGKAVVSDGGYGVIGGRYCLLVWGDAEETKGKRGRRWRGVGPAGRPSLFPLWR